MLIDKRLSQEVALSPDSLYHIVEICDQVHEDSFEPDMFR
jgi:hypothetical protein